MNNKLKSMSIIWGIVAILLFSFLTAMGFIYKNKTQKYKKLENNLVAITKKYTATDFNYPVDGKDIIISFKELSEKGLIKELKAGKNKCNGYVLVTFDNVTEYKAYIDCGKYKTHGFDKNKLKEQN